MKKIFGGILSLLLALFLGVQSFLPQPGLGEGISLDEVPEYSSAAYVELEGNVPNFTQEELGTTGREVYSALDLLGRCGPAFAVVGPETMPTEERGAIGQVKPSGWHLVKYDFVDGNYLYNRCHLIGYQLTGENANEQNLITGTRYLNVEGMLPFENQVADYVEETGNHVAYRVTPVFQDGELLARGVQMEAKSVEDDGAGVCFNVYVYNVQPGVDIDYTTGESRVVETEEQQEESAVPEQAAPQESVTQPDVSEEYQGETGYVLNLNSGRFHLPQCSGAATMSEKNKQISTESRETLLAQGYVPCGQCKP